MLKAALDKETNGQTAVYYIDKKRALSLLQGAGQQLPGGLSQGGSIHSIRDNGSKINPENEKFYTFAIIKKNEVVKAEYANNSNTNNSRSFNISLAQILSIVNKIGCDFRHSL